MSISRLRSRAGHAHGFTLLEAVIGLAILGVALLLGMALVIQLPRDVRRLDAERNAMRAMEASLEAMRAGAPPPPGIDAVHSSTTNPGLCQVTLTAHYTVFRTEQHQKQLQALFPESYCSTIWP